MIRGAAMSVIAQSAGASPAKPFNDIISYPLTVCKASCSWVLRQEAKRGLATQQIRNSTLQQMIDRPDSFMRFARRASSTWRE